MFKDPVAAGRAGGLATLERHGREHYVACGRAGGRPTRQEARDKAWAEINEAVRRARARKRKEESDITPALAPTE